MVFQAFLSFHKTGNRLIGYDLLTIVVNKIQFKDGEQIYEALEYNLTKL